jgi:hypothetical protein
MPSHRDPSISRRRFMKFVAGDLLNDPPNEQHANTDVPNQLQ